MRYDWIITVTNFANGNGTDIYKLTDRTIEEVGEMIEADAAQWRDYSGEEGNVEIEKLEPFGWWCGVVGKEATDYQIEARAYIWLDEYTF